MVWKENVKGNSMHFISIHKILLVTKYQFQHILPLHTKNITKILPK